MPTMRNRLLLHLIPLSLLLGCTTPPLQDIQLQGAEAEAAFTEYWDGKELPREFPKRFRSVVTVDTVGFVPGDSEAGMTMSLESRFALMSREEFLGEMGLVIEALGMILTTEAVLSCGEHGLQFLLPDKTFLGLIDMPDPGDGWVVSWPLLEMGMNSGRAAVEGLLDGLDAEKHVRYSPFLEALARHFAPAAILHPQSSLDLLVKFPFFELQSMEVLDGVATVHWMFSGDFTDTASDWRNPDMVHILGNAKLHASWDVRTGEAICWGFRIEGEGVNPDSAESAWMEWDFRFLPAEDEDWNIVPADPDSLTSLDDLLLSGVSSAEEI